MAGRVTKKKATKKKSTPGELVVTVVVEGDCKTTTLDKMGGGKPLIFKNGVVVVACKTKPKR